MRISTVQVREGDYERCFASANETVSLVKDRENEELADQLGVGDLLLDLESPRYESSLYLAGLACSQLRSEVPKARLHRLTQQMITEGSN